MEELRREFETFKLNTAREIENLRRNQNQVLTHLNLDKDNTPTSTPSFTSSPLQTPLDTSPTVENSEVPPAKKRRKTISKKYEGDEQKMLLYGGVKVHIQVASKFNH